MKKIKKNKGVTLVALALTIVVATLLIVSVSVSVDKLSTSNDFYKTRQDIIALQKAVQTYYLAHDNQLPPGTNTIAYNFTSVITAEENEQDQRRTGRYDPQRPVFRRPSGTYLLWNGTSGHRHAEDGLHVDYHSGRQHYVLVAASYIARQQFHRRGTYQEFPRKWPLDGT